MRKQFNLQDWLKDKSQKVETKDGRPVKIISFEMTDTNDCPIAAQFRLCAGTPVVYLFDKEGHYKGEGDSDYDLFIVTPETELTEFEATLLSYLSDDTSGELDKETMHKCVKARAEELLELAKKELDSEEGKVMLYVNEKAYKIGFRDGKAEGYKKAMKEFKELPALTWPPKPIPALFPACPYGSQCTNPMRDCINCPLYSTNVCTTTVTSASKVEGKE